MAHVWNRRAWRSTTETRLTRFVVAAPVTAWANCTLGPSLPANQFVAVCFVHGSEPSFRVLAITSRAARPGCALPWALSFLEPAQR